MREESKCESSLCRRGEGGRLEIKEREKGDGGEREQEVRDQGQKEKRGGNQGQRERGREVREGDRDLRERWRSETEEMVAQERCQWDRRGRSERKNRWSQR